VPSAAALFKSGVSYVAHQMMERNATQRVAFFPGPAQEGLSPTKCSVSILNGWGLRPGSPHRFRFTRVGEVIQNISIAEVKP
jgi:hypothetical protein